MKNKRDNTNPERHFYVGGHSTILQFKEVILKRMESETKHITQEQWEILDSMKRLIQAVDQTEKDLNYWYEKFNLIDDFKEVPKKAKPVQKFHRGDIVRVDVKKGKGMDHFTTGMEAIVEYSYKDAYGGSNVDDYSILYEEKDHNGKIRPNGSAWYDTEDLTLIKKDDGTAIENFKKKWPKFKFDDLETIRTKFNARVDRAWEALRKHSSQ